MVKRQDAQDDENDETALKQLHELDIQVVAKDKKVTTSHLGAPMNFISRKEMLHTFGIKLDDICNDIYEIPCEELLNMPDLTDFPTAGWKAALEEERVPIRAVKFRSSENMRRSYFFCKRDLYLWDNWRMKNRQKLISEEVKRKKALALADPTLNQQHFEVQRMGPHQCTECPATFKTQRHLSSHLEDHADGKLPVACHVCHRAFKSPKILQRHMLQHGNYELNPYQCVHCKQRFVQAAHLLTHINAKHRPFPEEQPRLLICPLCHTERPKVLNLRSKKLSPEQKERLRLEEERLHKETAEQAKGFQTRDPRELVRHILQCVERVKRNQKTHQKYDEVARAVGTNNERSVA
eukprot:gb/GEZN01011179.1/.p1 GENE.gb/GEZN01011179.1/~~gb/GEZN01011179.1/.p1  ORF type:complete len:381 (-),score=55.72 gb/GEZN01011179.1/:37-1089(-)